MNHFIDSSRLPQLLAMPQDNNNMLRTNGHVRYWHKADMPQIGHERVKFALRLVRIAEDQT
jgi:hypothetical protein